MSRFKGTPEQERALDAYVKLLRAGNSATQAVMRGVAEAGLTPTQFAVLEALHYSPQNGTMCLSEIAQKILTSSGNLTLVVNNLEKRGLARRRQAGSDRRYIALEITPRGERIMRQIFPAHVEAIVKTMSHLSAAEQEALASLCRKLGLAEKESGEI